MTAPGITPTEFGPKSLSATIQKAQESIFRNLLPQRANELAVLIMRSLQSDHAVEALEQLVENGTVRRYLPSRQSLHRVIAHPQGLSLSRESELALQIEIAVTKRPIGSLSQNETYWSHVLANLRVFENVLESRSDFDKSQKWILKTVCFFNALSQVPAIINQTNNPTRHTKSSNLLSDACLSWNTTEHYKKEGPQTLITNGLKFFGLNVINGIGKIYSLIVSKSGQWEDLESKILDQSEKASTLHLAIERKLALIISHLHSRVMINDEIKVEAVFNGALLIINSGLALLDPSRLRGLDTAKEWDRLQRKYDRLISHISLLQKAFPKMIEGDYQKLHWLRLDIPLVQPSELKMLGVSTKDCTSVIEKVEMALIEGEIPNNREAALWFAAQLGSYGPDKAQVIPETIKRILESPSSAIDGLNRSSSNLSILSKYEGVQFRIELYKYEEHPIQFPYDIPQEFVLSEALSGKYPTLKRWIAAHNVSGKELKELIFQRGFGDFIELDSFLIQHWRFDPREILRTRYATAPQMSVFRLSDNQRTFVSFGFQIADQKDGSGLQHIAFRRMDEVLKHYKEDTLTENEALLYFFEKGVTSVIGGGWFDLPSTQRENVIIRSGAVKDNDKLYTSVVLDRSLMNDTWHFTTVFLHRSASEAGSYLRNQINQLKRAGRFSAIEAERAHENLKLMLRRERP